MQFLVVEQREPHAGRMAFADVAQPGTLAERCALARRLRDELEVPLPILVDGMDDGSRALFSDLPAPAFVLGPDGTIVDKLPWADPEPLGRSIAAALATKAATPVLPAEPTGDQQAHGSGPVVLAEPTGKLPQRTAAALASRRWLHRRGGGV